MTSVDYKQAGVDIAAGNEAVKRIKHAVESTFTQDVLTSLGSFGAMYDLKSIVNQYQHPVLVQSIDGVGTKIMVAKRMHKFDTIGMDLVSATANDIIVLGAKPLTLLDYIANDRLDPFIIEQIIHGMVIACRENNIALVGGETAEMPGTYRPNEHDLVGVITGIVEKEKAILGQGITKGDVVLAFPASGLHTNGYSLARKLLFEVAGYQVDTLLPALGASVGEALLEPHLNYTQPVMHLLASGIAIKGMAHITGGGVIENIPRILPMGTGVEIDLQRCPKLAIFDLLKQLGRLSQYEAYRTFNMGVGYVLILSQSEAHRAQALFDKTACYPLIEIGRVVGHDQDDSSRVRLI